MTELDSKVCLDRRHCAVAALRYVAQGQIHADHEPQALEQDGADVFCVHGVCGRAGVRVRTRQCACLCSLLAVKEARPHAPP